jgi:lipopolysaccharide biosynthesis glycosyltransferase
MKFISYYTPQYIQEAQKLRQSLESNLLNYHIAGIEDKGSWDANTHYKPIFIRQQLQNESAVVWLDADCMVLSYPKIFFELNCDVAFHRFKGKELLSGTVYFNNTAKTSELLQKWIDINQENPEIFDQKNLDQALKSISDISIIELPPEYCFIYDLSKNYYPRVNPIIEHYQASRKFR